jgi:DNA-binding response OmpR family regulator
MMRARAPYAPSIPVTVSTPSNGSPKRPVILVVEDDSALLFMMERLLKPFADVRLATDGMEAYSSLRNEPKLPDLVVTDVMMPRLDGLQLVQRMKGDPALSRIPVIMLTAKSGPKDVVIGINAGVRHYVTKPFKHDELIGKVKKVLHLS